jgi:hypothetical protein
VLVGVQVLGLVTVLPLCVVYMTSSCVIAFDASRGMDTQP